MSARNLLDHHRTLLEASAISTDVAAERGYWSATKKTELGDLGFAGYQRLVPALVLPVRGPDGTVRNYQARPDTPRIDDERGRPIKYETIAGARMTLDVPPRSRVDLANPERVLWITEGVRKADALASAGECAVALLGVWAWRGTNDKGGKTALAEWDSIALNDRRVLLVFDSDAMTKRSVHQALERLAGFLESKGAVVRFVYLPADESKVGVDDYLADNGTIGQLRELAEPELRPFPADPEPDRQPAMATAKLLAIVEQLLRRFVRFASEHEPTVLALYILHTWAIDASRVTPYILISSPTKRSGKTRLLEVIELAAREPMRAASITEAALFQSIEAYQPTLLIDEVDAIFTGRSERAEALRGVLNAGNARGSYVIRGTQEGTPVKSSAFSAKVLAGIANGRLPDTIRDRSIVVKMERKLRTDELERLRPADLEDDIAELRGRLGEWAAEHVERLSGFRLAEPLLAVSDRLEEGWEPLLAIADHAGDGWPNRARAAAAGLAGGTDELDGQDTGVILLGALHGLFGDEHALASKVVCDRLNADDELPFGTFRGGQGIDQRGLGKLLRPYGIKPRTVRPDGEAATSRGYHREQLADVFERYLAKDARVADPALEATHPTHPTHPAPHATCDVSLVSLVSDEVQGLSRARVNGNGAHRSLFDEFGSEDGIVDAIIETFDATEIAEDEVRYLTAAEIAAWLEVSPREFANMRGARKIIPVVDTGGGRRSCWRTADLRALRPGADLPDHPDPRTLLSDSEHERADRYRESWPWLVAGAEEEVAS